MANRYVSSVSGNNANSGSTEALAKATAAGVDAIDGINDVIYFDQNHAEVTAAGVTLAFAGLAAAPTQLLSSSWAAEPPTSLVAGASIATSGANPINIRGYLYAYGITLNSCNGAVASGSIGLNYVGGEKQVWDNCTFWCSGSGASSWVQCGPTGTATACETVLINCKFKFGNSANGIGANSTVRIIGGSILAGGVDITRFIAQGPANRPLDVVITGFDFSNASTTMCILASIVAATGRVVLRNCKMPSGWTGGLIESTLSYPGQIIEAYNLDSGSTNYRYWLECYAGTIKDEHTIVKTGGASDGVTASSLKMTTPSGVAYPVACLELPHLSEHAVWNDTVGSAVTLTVDIVHDSATPLTDKEVVLRLHYMGDTASPLSSVVDDAAATVIVAASNQDASTATWTTTGMTNPNKQKLSVTFTPQQKGYLLWKVLLFKPLKTIYVDGKATLS